MFMGRMVKNPHDVLIFGRAIGLRHVEGRDDATPEETELRPWKAKWPHYVRLHHAELVGGILANGISLVEMMDVLKADAFASTQANSARGEGNTNPRLAYRRQPAVKLTPRAAAWLRAKLDGAFDQHGQYGSVELDHLP